MASDRFSRPANGTRYGDVHGTIGRAVPVTRTHDQFNHIDRITTPTPSDHGTQPQNLRTRYSSGFLRSCHSVPRRRFAGDLGLAPYKFHQDTRDGLPSSFVQQPGIPTGGKPPNSVNLSSETTLLARLSLYSSPDMPLLKPTHAQARAPTNQTRALPSSKAGVKPRNNQRLNSDEPGSPPKGKTAIEAAEWAESASKKRRCSSLFNKSFNFGPASKSSPSQTSPQVSPRSSICSRLSASMAGEPAERQRVNSSNPGALHSLSTRSSRTLAPDASSVTDSHQRVTRDRSLYSSPHPGHPVDFTTPHIELHEQGSALGSTLYLDSSVHESCFETSQRRVSSSKAYLHGQIAEEFARRGRLKHEEAQDEMCRAGFAEWASLVTLSNEAVQDSSASSKSSARTSSSGDTDSMEAFLRHVRASFEARKRRGLDSGVFEDEVGRACVSSEPL